VRRPPRPQPPKPEIRKPFVLFDRKASAALNRGFYQMAEVMAVTLGPTQGTVLSAREPKGEPEILEDAATIARRIIAIPNRGADVGAMLMRNIAWRVHKRSGDGAATAAVLAQAILREATHYVRAGGNPMLVRRGMERATVAALEDLARQAQPVRSEEELTHVAETLTAEPAMSLVLGEMFDVLGPTAHITVENYVAPYLERVYYAGGRWQARLESIYIITDVAGKRAVQEDCQVLLYAGRLKTADDVLPLLELLARSDKRAVLIVAQETSGDALNALITNHVKGTIKVIVVTPRRVGDQQKNDFSDLALLTGATLLGTDVGSSLTDLQPTHFGRAQRVEATADSMVITGGGGDPTAVRERIEQLRVLLSGMLDTDEGRDEVKLRLARLSGGVGVLKIGAHTKVERSVLHDKAEKAIKALQIVMEEGVVPGGGVAYLHASDAVRALAATMTRDERQGALILARALEEPFRRIVCNCGTREPSTALAEVRRCGDGYVYDAVADRVVPVKECGLLDPTGVLRVALETGASGGMSALTISVIVLRKKPVESFEP
jgi:chaperonin GroEL